MMRLVVAAAVVERDGTFLVTRRQKGVHLEDHWEFPGGKCEPSESLCDCLARELREELDVAVAVGPEVLATLHEYPDRQVELHFLRCELLGDPVPQLGQAMAWVRREDLRTLTWPPADAELIEILSR
jgi:8-oxo-dGTP diphosphatase